MIHSQAVHVNGFRSVVRMEQHKCVVIDAQFPDEIRKTPHQNVQFPALRQRSLTWTAREIFDEVPEN